MRLLLDTHAFLWFFTDDPQLSATAKALIADPTNEEIKGVKEIKGVRSLFPLIYQQFQMKRADSITNSITAI